MILCQDDAMGIFKGTPLPQSPHNLHVSIGSPENCTHNVQIDIWREQEGLTKVC